MRQIHARPKPRSPKAELVEILTWIQILVARESSLSTIWTVAEEGILKLKDGH